MPRDASDQLRERDGELGAIDAAVAAAHEGDARLLIIEGAAGIGKSRLVAELRARAAAAGVRVLSARGSELEGDFPFGAVRQLFEATVLQPARAEALFAGAATAARPIFTSLPGGDDEPDASFAALHGLFWLTVNLAGDEPLLLVVDDLHWCDRPSLRFLAYLAKRLDGLPVSLAVSLRPAEPGVDAALVAELTTDPLAVSLRPAALSGDAVASVIADRLGAEPDEAFVEACFSASGGNPLLLHELARALQAEGATPVAAHVETVRQVGPRAASRAVLLRLSRLSPAAVSVARAVAVLGDGAGIEVVAALAELDRAAAARAVEELARVEILRPERPLGFVHPLLRAAVYGDLPAAEREQAHERAARLLTEIEASGDQIASHLISTPGRGDPWVVDTLADAARVALSRGAPDSAVAYLSRAVAEPPESERLPELQLRLGMAESQVQGPNSVAHLQAAYEGTRDPLLRARAATQLGTIYFLLGRAAEGGMLAKRAADALGPEHHDLKLQLEAVRLTVPLYDPSAMPFDHPDIVRWRTEPLGDGPGARMVAGAVAYHWALIGGPREPCLALARHCVGGGVLAGIAGGSVPYVAGQLVLLKADEPDGLDAVMEADRAAHAVGSLLGGSAGRLFSGLGAYFRGDIAEAEARERDAMRQTDAWGFVSVRLFPGALLAHVLIDKGDLDGARAALAHANPDDSPMPENSNSAYWLFPRLRYLLARGENEAALALAEDCRRRFAGTMANPAWFPWRSLGARALDRLGRSEEAIALADEEVALARVWGAPRPLSRSLRTLGVIRREEGMEMLEEAVSVTEGTPFRLEHAKALVALGTALRRARRPTEAREPLSRALDLAVVCEAGAVAESARTELRAAGIRPRTEALSGVGALTASERRVAQAAAAGQSNKDIAQALYVTPKTVEVHLSAAYRKLGIRSRRELEGALVGGALIP